MEGQNLILHRRTKHIDILYDFVREAIEKKETEVKYLPSEEKVVDYLSKALPFTKLRFCIDNSVLEIY